MTNYYCERKATLLNSFDKWSQIIKGIVSSIYSSDFCEELIKDARNIFENLIPEIPFIGGDENQMTKLIIWSAQWLSVYKASSARKLKTEDVGRLIYEEFRFQMNRTSKAELEKIGNQRFSDEYLTKQKELALRSLKGDYSVDWLFTIVEGDGQDFDYGYDYQQCAIYSFYKAHDCSELVPYICLTDFYSSQALGLGLTRTKTLADGFDICDFRYKKGRETVIIDGPNFLTDKK